MVSFDIFGAARPPKDMSDNAYFQNSLYVGNNFNWILYGVNLVLYAQTMYIYASSKSPHGRSARFFMSFSTVILVLITVYIITQSIFGQDMWITNTNYPGGSAAYLVANGSDWYQTMGTTSFVILQLMSDGLLIYRYLIVWRGRRIIVLPCFLWLVTVAFGIFNVYASGSPNGSSFVSFASHNGVIYVATSIALNVLMTSLICERIVYYAHSTQRLGLGIAETYFNKIALLVVESALLYTLCGIAFVFSLSMNSEISILFLSLYAMFMCLSPQMLILRVASGRAWSSDMGRRTVAAIQFDRHPDPAATTFTAAGLLTTDKNDRGKLASLKDEDVGLKV